ncbi:MAG: hypothetical protein ACM3JD_12070, partial [Rudaea sp.]
MLIGLFLVVLPVMSAAAARPPAVKQVASGQVPNPVAESEAAAGPFIEAPVPAHAFKGDVRTLPHIRKVVGPRVPYQEGQDIHQRDPDQADPNRIGASADPDQIDSGQDPDQLEPDQASAAGASRSKSGPVRDSVLQAAAAGSTMPALGLNFKGLSKPSWGVAIPPDPNGDVGPNHYIQTVNTSIGIFDKSGNQLAAFNFNTFFSSGGGTGTACDVNNNKGSDPVVVYDALADRWLITNHTAATFTSTWYECIAISQSGDPVLGGWWFYAMPVDPTLINDATKIGVWPDAYYMSANMFRPSPYAFDHVRVWALDRSALLTGGALQSVRFDLPCAFQCKQYLLPSDLRGTPPPPGTPNYFANIFAPTQFNIWKFHVDWANLAASTFTGPTTLAVASFANQTSGIPELNGAGLYHSGDHLMPQLQYRYINGVESLWANHTVASGTVTGIRWYEIRSPGASPSVYQQGTFQPDSNYRWIGSLAADGSGNMAVGYSISSPSM